MSQPHAAINGSETRLDLILVELQLLRQELATLTAALVPSSPPVTPAENLERARALAIRGLGSLTEEVDLTEPAKPARRRKA